MPNWSDDEGRCHFDVNGVPCYQSDVGCPMHRGACLLKHPRKRREKRYTRAEVLAFGERVRESCAEVVDGCAVDESPSAPNYLDDVADMLRAVDVARLLEEDK